MVTVNADYSNSRYRAAAGEGWDGVVRLSNNGYYGTGVLLYDGRAVLTAAHLFARGIADTQVSFETLSGTRNYQVDGVLLHPEYDAVNLNHDFALVWLAEAAPSNAERYELYRTQDELGQVFDLVGYGLTGTGSTGALSTSGSVRHVASNRFDAFASDLLAARAIVWQPGKELQLIADFDSGGYGHDALSQLLGVSDRGLGLDEGIIASGDSGGPAFLNNQVAGIASYIASLSGDGDGLTNSTFGEVAAWQRVSVQQQWIDQSLRANYEDAPTQASEVQLRVTEGDSGVQRAYFFVAFNGLRETGDWITLDYATRDGTAQAGTDYVAVSGQLNLYPDERYAVIPVEILGDAQVEPDETFYLDVFNIQGAAFAGQAIQLTAMRTIVDDDALAAV